jgi:hypothetical protein
MSNNAVRAYENGEKPLSKWTKGEILEAIEEMVEAGEVELKCDLTQLGKIPTKKLKEVCLVRTSWHHTSKHYNKTDFHSVDEWAVERLTDEKIREIVADAKAERTVKEEPSEETWECEFLIWGGTRKHPKAETHTEIGTIRGNWFYRQDGSKKSITANGFRQIKKIK